MAERESHPPGTLSWTDLSTSDVEGAKHFYGELFGWAFEDQPVPEGMVYSMARLRGRDVAALSGTQAGQSPHWNVYVTVALADEAAARAVELEATVLAGPFEVFDAGRMAVVQDPTGAYLATWEPRRHHGARLVNEPGALTWADLVTPDPDRAARFYAAWLGWAIEELPGADGYRLIRNRGRTNGGMLAQRPEATAGAPPHWMPYFGVEDLDAARTHLDRLGGRTLAGPAAVPNGAFAIVSDPHGAAVAVWAGTYDED